MLRAWGTEGGYGGLPLQAQVVPLHDSGDEPGGLNSLTRQKPLVFSQKGGELLQQMASNFEKKQKQQQQHQQRLKAAASNPYHQPQPDPVLWFPGGDAECGVNAGPNNDMSTFSIIALMLSIFNIIDLLVTNANNNNNRNNINDNANNNNDNSNTESNGNPDQASANQAMFTPPGAGRRKRDARDSSLQPMILKPEIMDNMMRLNIHPKDSANSSEALHSAWYAMNNVTKVQDELVLGMSMVTNAWHLMEGGNMKCQLRNLCELGFNGSVWGAMAELVVDIMGKVMARWISEDEVMEVEMVNALKHGVVEGRDFRDGQDYESCDGMFSDVCPLESWNMFVIETKNNAHMM